METGRREDRRMKDKIKRTDGSRKERRKQEDMLVAENRHGREGGRDE